MDLGILKGLGRGYCIVVQTKNMGGGKYLKVPLFNRG